MKKEKDSTKYNLVICGGTFDRLHVGHKAFLREAFLQGKKVIIGVTSDAYVAAYKRGEDILPYVQRKQSLEVFLKEIGVLERSQIVEIHDKFDKTQTITDPSVALLVSEETYSAGLEINRKREMQNLFPLPLIVFSFITDKNGNKISSSNIRRGLIDRNGIFLPDSSLLHKSLIMPSSLRQQLHKPFGELITAEIPEKYLQHPEKIVSVGDITTKRLHTLGIRQQISIIDFQVERKKTNESLQDLGFRGDEKVIHLENPAGQITSYVWEKLSFAINHLNKKIVIEVVGEEDLLVIPLILMLPLGFYLLYGQPEMGEFKKGIVVVEITEDIKSKTYDVLNLFE